MEFNPELIKKHPYATGAVVIIGGLVVFYLLSRQSGGAQTASGTSNSGAYTAALQASEQMAQLNSAQQIAQMNAQNQAQANQLQANIVNNQTTAQLEAAIVGSQTSLAANRDTLAAQTAQQANQLQYAANIQQMQDSVLTSQISAGVQEQANAEATQLAGIQTQANYQQNIAQMQAGLLSQNMTNQQAINTAVLAKAGQSYNTREDADRATAIEQTLISGGSPYVAASGNNLILSGETSGNASTTAMWNSLSNIAGAVAGGFFA